MIVQEVFALVKRRVGIEVFPERSGGALGGDLGCRGKGRQSLYPLLIHVVETLLLFFLIPSIPLAPRPRNYVFYASILRAFRRDGRCGPSGRGCRQRW